MAQKILAKSYQGAEIVKEYEKGGKSYATIKIQCDRCVKGVFVCGVENGQLKPHPAYNGVCLKCGGTGYLVKEARLYTPEEYEKMEAANEKARIKRQAEQEQKMKAEFAQKKADWLAKNGFSPEGITYIVIGDSYSIKDELKAAGWKYDTILKWHKADPAGYEDRTVEINVNDYFEFSAWGEGHYLSTAKKKINELLAGTQPQYASVWAGEVGEKVKDIKVQLIRKYSFETKYGFSTVFTFVDEKERVFTWFTSTFQPFEQGDYLVIASGTIKKLDTYNDVAQTQLTRCKLRAI